MNSVFLLLLALLPLLAGPYLSRWADRSEGAKSVMDSLIAVSLGGIVVLYIWPGAFHVAGWPALMIGLLGFALPFLLHGQLHAHEKKAFPGLLWLAFLGLALHAFADGVALFGPEAGHAHGEADAHDRSSATLLALAVVLHRLPTALAIWWLVFPRLGQRSAMLMLLSVAVATVLGFLYGGRFLEGLETPGVAMFEAGVAGMLMHIVFGHEHRHAALPAAAPARMTSAWGAVLGVALLVGVGYVHSFEALGEALPSRVHGWLNALPMAALPLVLAFLIWAIRARSALRERHHHPPA